MTLDRLLAVLGIGQHRRTVMLALTAETPSKRLTIYAFHRARLFYISIFAVKLYAAKQTFDRVMNMYQNGSMSVLDY